MKSETLKIIFPSYEQVVASNNLNRYKGWEFKVHMAENLYLYIDCQNENAIFPNKKPLICFRWCTNNEFPIATIKYENCEAGYYAGIEFLIKTAEAFQKAFGEFLNNSRIVE